MPGLIGMVLVLALSLQLLRLQDRINGLVPFTGLMAAIALGRMARSAGTLLSLVGADVTAGERRFVTIASIPKATVPADVGGTGAATLRGRPRRVGPRHVPLPRGVREQALTKAAAA